MRIAYFDVYSGISGDMTVAAFLDAGLDIGVLSKQLKKLKINGYEIRKSKVTRGSLSGTKFDCIVKSKRVVHRSVKDIIAIIEKSSLNRRVKDIAEGIFKNIGTAESRIHNTRSAKNVYLHELGSIDSIIDIVGAAIAIDELGIDEIYSSPVNLGRTFADTAHGRIPIPGPASLELLKGVPVKILDIDAELVTPTGAGILKTLVKGFGEIPEMTITHIGYGAGSRDIAEIPNMLRVMIGERKESFLKDRILVVETNIDDMAPQNFEYLFERLFKEGALDVYAAHIQMKKSRAAFKLTVLAEPASLEKISNVIFSESTSIGLRFHESNRLKLERKVVKVNTKYGKIDVKVSKGLDNIMTISPEYEECAKLAREKRVPLKTIYEEAKHAVRV